MAYKDDLESTRDQIAANLKAMTEMPKPTYSLNGKSVSWSEMFSSYCQQLEQINRLIAQAEGPAWETIQGMT